MLLHADVMSLTQQLGLSYKDAAHRLYSAEIERLKMADSATNQAADSKSCFSGAGPAH